MVSGGLDTGKPPVILQLRNKHEGNRIVASPQNSYPTDKCGLKVTYDTRVFSACTSVPAARRPRASPSGNCTCSDGRVSHRLNKLVWRSISGEHPALDTLDLHVPQHVGHRPCWYQATNTVVESDCKLQTLKENNANARPWMNWSRRSSNRTSFRFRGRPCNCCLRIPGHRWR